MDIFRLVEPQRTHQTTEAFPLHLCVSFKFGFDVGATKDTVSAASGRPILLPCHLWLFYPSGIQLAGLSLTESRLLVQPIATGLLSQRRVVVLLNPGPPQAAAIATLGRIRSLHSPQCQSLVRSEF